MISAYENILKEKHLSLTSARIAVLQTLDAQPHIDADQVYKSVKEKLITTSKQAIYNNLHTLVEHGIVREIRPKGRPSLFETRTDDNHHHLICRQCDVITDTDCLTSAPCLSAVENHGFAIDEAEITFWGLCPTCQQPNNHKGD